MLFFAINEHGPFFHRLADAAGADYYYCYNENKLDVIRAIYGCECDALVVWGGSHPLQQFVIAHAMVKGAKILYVEGGRRIGTLQIGCGGLYASNPRLLDWNTRPRLLTDAEMADARAEIVARDGDSVLPDELPDEFVFFPMQMDGDLQIVNHSPKYRHILHALADVYASALAAGIKLVIKMHPLEESPSIMADVIGLCQRAIVLPATAPLVPLLDRCLAVVTINSTVGIEAMYYEKPVIILGDAEYASPLLALMPDDDVTLYGLLRRLHSKRMESFVSSMERRRFLAMIQDEMVPYYPWQDHIDDVAKRIMEEQL